MKHLTGLFLLITLQGCMLMNGHAGHGMMNHGKADATQTTPANGASSAPVSETTPHSH